MLRSYFKLICIYFYLEIILSSLYLEYDRWLWLLSSLTSLLTKKKKIHWYGFSVYDVDCSRVSEQYVSLLVVAWILWHLLSITRTCEHVNLILSSLHWLLVCFRIDFCPLISFKFLFYFIPKCVWPYHLDILYFFYFFLCHCLSWQELLFLASYKALFIWKVPCLDKCLIQKLVVCWLLCSSWSMCSYKHLRDFSPH